MTRDETAKLLATLSAAYQRRVEPETLEAWALFLADKAYQPIAAAARAHVDESPYFPQIADLVSRVKAAQPIPRPACLECGAEAIATVDGRGAFCAQHHPAACDSQRARLSSEGVVSLGDAAAKILAGLRTRHVGSVQRASA